jgi:hypothetical protein
MNAADRADAQSGEFLCVAAGAGMAGLVLYGEKVSNLLLGALLILIGVAVLLGGYAAGFREFASAEFFPALLATSMCALGVLLMSVSRLTRGLPPFRWTWFTLLAAGVLAFAINIGLAMYFARHFLLLGPPEYAATIFLLLAMAVAFARRSHLRAAGMVLIGLLISTVGVDIITGRLRFTGGNEALFDGFDFLIVAPAVIVIGEAMLCLYSPRLWFSTFARWLVPTLAIGPRWPAFLRVLCVIAIAASLWLAWEVNHRVFDILSAICFAVFGAACMLFGWNRLIFCVAFFYGRQFEQLLRQALVIAQDNLMVFLERPQSAIQIAIAVAVLAVAFGLWVWRVVRLLRAKRAQPV